MIQCCYFQILVVKKLPKRVSSFSSQLLEILSLIIRRDLSDWQLFDFPQTGIERIASFFQRQLDHGIFSLLQTEKAFVIGMDEEEQVMCANLVLIGQGLVNLMEMNEPSEAAGVGGDDVVLIEVVLFSGDVAPVGDVLDAQRRLQLYHVAFLFKRTEGLQFED